MTKVLLIEDDPGTAREIIFELEATGYIVEHRDTLDRGISCAMGGGLDVMIVDRMLPDGDGLDVISRLRAMGSRTPALVLSALGSLDDRVRGLRSGGDDYLSKPFALIELVARIEALLRRPIDTRETRLVSGLITLDLLEGTATRADRPLELLPREMQMLEYFVRRPGSIVTRAMLLRDVWGYTYEPNSNVVDVHLGRLRRKIEAAGEAPVIRNVRGQGYRYDVPR